MEEFLTNKLLDSEYNIIMKYSTEPTIIHNQLKLLLDIIICVVASNKDVLIETYNCGKINYLIGKYINDRIKSGSDKTLQELKT